MVSRSVSTGMWVAASERGAVPRDHALRSPWARWREAVINLLALLALLSVGIVWSTAFAAEASGFQSGSLLLKSAPDAEPVQALRVATSIRAQVTANIARVRVSQQFVNAGDHWVEGLYVYPLSDGSAVDELLMQVGERTIRGDIRERDAAHAAYQQARRQGQRASLLDQERPNMFTTTVANIAPQSSVTVEIAYLETIAYRDGGYTLRLPLAITPRYSPGVALDPAAPRALENSRAANAGLGASATPERVTAALQHVDIDVELAAGFALKSVRSLHHQVSVTPDAMGEHVKLVGSQVPADRDFELLWTPAAVATVQAAVFAERKDEDTYALLLLTPPAAATTAPPQREVIFIIDTSGSMYGPSIEQARAALQLGVARLTDVDRFNVIRFSNDASSLFATPLAVSPATRAAASRFIASLQASGGTEMRTALELAFATQPPADLLRQIVFVTDGGVSNEAELVALIRSRIGAARLFTVGIGAAPNAYFLRTAAAAGRGSYTFIAQRDQVGERMEDLFRKLEQPALMDLKVNWPDARPELAADLPGDLYAGDPLVILARLPSVPSVPSGALTLAGRRTGGAWVEQMAIMPVGEQSGIAKLWARERIAELMRLRSLGGGGTVSLQASIVQLALQHHLVSEFTSLVAVDDAPARPAGTAYRAEQAPTAAPIGSYWAATPATAGFAQTATPAPRLALLGCLALACAGLLCGLLLMELAPAAGAGRKRPRAER